MFKFFFALVAITTMLSIGIVGKIGKVETQTAQALKPAPVLIGADGSLTFPARKPSPDVVYNMRRALKMEDIEKLNALLFENQLFVAPNN